MSAPDGFQAPGVAGLAPEPAGDPSAVGETVCLTIVSTYGPNGKDIATFGELQATSAKRSASRKLARMMVAAGIADAPIQCVSSAGSLQWSYRSLVEFAAYDIVEEPRLHRTKWVPNPLWAKGDEA